MNTLFGSLDWSLEGPAVRALAFPLATLFECNRCEWHQSAPLGLTRQEKATIARGHLVAVHGQRLPVLQSVPLHGGQGCIA